MKRLYRCIACVALVFTAGACDSSASEEAPAAEPSVAPVEEQSDESPPEPAAAEPSSHDIQGEEADAVRAFVRTITEAWNAGDQDRYLSLFAEELRCFHGRPDFPRARLGRERLRAPMGDTVLVTKAIHVVSLEGDHAIAIDHGAWLSRTNRSGVHHKAYWLERADGRWRVTAEVPARDTAALGECSLEPPSAWPPAPSELIGCRARNRVCGRRCGPACEDRRSEDCASCRSGCAGALAECIRVDRPTWASGSPPPITQTEIDRLKDLARGVGTAGAADESGEAVEPDDAPPVRVTLATGDILDVRKLLERIPADRASDDRCRDEVRRCATAVCDGLKYDQHVSCMSECAPAAACFQCGDTHSCCELVYDAPEVAERIEQHTGDRCSAPSPDYVSDF
jgi:uncharacterized protein (TIGR02246 family)